jgi:hypothetical protein
MLEKGSRNATAKLRIGLLFASFVVVFSFLGVGFAFGPDAVAQTAGNATQNLDAVGSAAGFSATATDLPTIIGRIIYVFLGAIGIVLLGLILFAGYLWMTAAGDEKQVQSAKDRIRNAVIGLVIIASSFAIVSFIMSQLTGSSMFGGLDGSGGGSGIISGFPGSAGSLGNGRIRDVSPLPGSRSVPRNTGIMITFTEPVRINSFIQGYDDRGTPADLTDDASSSTTIGLNPATIKIYPTADGPSRALTSEQVRVRFTSDRQTFVFKPVEPLGSAARPMDYTVELVGGTRGALLETCPPDRRECPVFEGSHSSGYRWQFQLSTTLDLTPPRVMSTMPVSASSYAPNVIIQYNFDEAIDPTSVDASNLGISARNSGGLVTRPAGRYSITNGYTTVEFVTNVSCGINSCGRQVFCLPASSTISVIARAATLSPTPPQAAIVRGLFDGIVDAAWNSLDGNANGTGEGPGRDDYSVTFSTTDRPNLSAPIIRQITPGPNTGSIPPDQQPTARFDSILQASTVVTQNVKILTNEADPDVFWWVPRVETLTGDGRLATPGTIPAASRITIPHRIYMATSSRTFVPEYYPSVYSGVQNLYQNCFNPASSNNATDAPQTCAGSPNCCADVSGAPRMVPSSVACAYPVTSRP